MGSPDAKKSDPLAVDAAQLRRDLLASILTRAKKDGVSTGHLLGEVGLDRFFNVDAEAMKDAHALGRACFKMAIGSDGEWEPVGAFVIIAGVTAFMVESGWSVPSAERKTELNELRRNKPTDAALDAWFDLAFPA